MCSVVGIYSHALPTLNFDFQLLARALELGIRLVVEGVSMADFVCICMCGLLCAGGGSEGFMSVRKIVV